MLDGIQIDLSKEDCKVKSEDGVRCTLDAVHVAAGSSHMGRTEEGLVFWKDVPRGE
jgi:hypothetical protein